MSHINNFDFQVFTGHKYWWNMPTNQSEDKIHSMALWVMGKDKIIKKDYDLTTIVSDNGYFSKEI